MNAQAAPAHVEGDMSPLITYDPSLPSKGKIKPFYSQNRRRGGGFGAFLSSVGRFAKPLIKKILSGTATELMKKRARRFGQSAFNEAANALSSYALDRMKIHPLSSPKPGSKRGGEIGRRGRVTAGGRGKRKVGGAYVGDDSNDDDNQDDNEGDDESHAASGQDEDLLNHSSRRRLPGDFGVNSVLPIKRLLSVKNKRRRLTVKKKKKKRAIARKKKIRPRLTKKKKKSKRSLKKSKKVKGGASGKNKRQKTKKKGASIFD